MSTITIHFTHTQTHCIHKLNTGYINMLWGFEQETEANTLSKTTEKIIKVTATVPLNKGMTIPKQRIGPFDQAMRLRCVVINSVVTE